MAQTGARSSAIMAAGTLVSRVLGFAKTILITVAIGSAANIADVFALSNQLPNLIYVLIAGGVFNAVLVPQIIKAFNRSDGGADYISRLISLALITLLAVTAVIVALAYPIMRVMSSGWTEDQIQLGTVFALWCFPQIFFYGLYTVIGQVLNAKEAFGWYMWAPVLNNLVAIAALIVFIALFGSYAHAGHDISNWTSVKTFWLVGTATLGVVCQALILLIPLKRLRLGLSLKFGWRGIGLGKAAKIAGWTLATGIVANLSFLYLFHVSTIPAGHREEYASRGMVIAGNSILDQATMLYQLPHGVIGISIATVLFNRMARSAAENDNQQLIATLSRGLRVTAVATIFCSVALIIFAGPIGMMFSGGNPRVGALIGQVVTVIAVGGPFLTTAFMMGRMFYAHEDAKTPLINQSISAVLVIILGFLVSHLAPDHIVFALAGLYAAQNIFATLLYHRGLRAWLGDYDVANIVKTHLRVTLAALLAGVGGYLVLLLFGTQRLSGFAWDNQLTAFVTILVGGAVMGVLYLGTLRLFHVRELDGMISMVKTRLGK